jgi:hypothetical protein
MNFLHIVFIYLIFQLFLPFLFQVLVGWSSEIYTFESFSGSNIHELFIVSLSLAAIFLSSLYFFPLRIKLVTTGHPLKTVISIFGLRGIRCFAVLMLFSSTLAFIDGANSYRYTINSFSNSLNDSSPLILLVPTLNGLVGLSLLVTALYERSDSDRQKYVWSIYMLCLASVLSITGLASALNGSLLVALNLLPIKFRNFFFSRDSFLIKNFKIRRKVFFFILASFSFLFVIGLPLLALGLYTKSQSDVLAQAEGYLNFSWFVDRLSPQLVSYFASFDSSSLSSQSYLSDYLSNAFYRLSLILRSFGFINIDLERPAILLDVRNALNIQSSLLPLNFRSGTSPGLIASFVYVFDFASIVLVPLYVLLVYKILKPVLSAIPHPPSLQLNLLISFQFLPIFFQSPFSPMLIFDESFLMIILVLWLRFRLSQL